MNFKLIIDGYLQNLYPKIEDGYDTPKKISKNSDVYVARKTKERSK